MKILAAVLIVLSPALALAQPSGVVPQAERLDVATLRPNYPHRLFALNSFGDDGVKILNGDTLQMEGMVPAAGASVFALDPAGRYFYVCESIWTRHNRGTRQDLLSVYDSHTLNLLSEIALPTGRLIVDALTHNCDVSASGKYAYIYNMQPASSIVVVNLEQRKVASVIEVPGCALALPWQDGGFVSLCGDGSISSVVLNEAGRSQAMSHTARFFDADNDPIFSESLVDRSSGRALLFSYTGLVFAAQLGEHPSVEKPWSLQVAAGMRAASTGTQDLAWRPGGLGMFAWHKATNRLFVLMHVGDHWTQKKAGTEVWVLDIAAHTLIKRVQLQDPAVSIAVSQDAQPLLYVLSRGGDITTFDATTEEQKVKGDAPAGRVVWVPGF